MLYRGEKPAALYRGVYKPGKIYRGAQLVAGYADVSKAAPASWDGTYDDVVGAAATGKGKQQTYSGKNLFDPGWLTGLPGWTQDGDVYSGPMSAANTAYGSGTSGFPIAFDDGKQYTITYYIQAEAETQMAKFVVTYTDGTLAQLPLSTVSRQFVSLITTAGKTVAKLWFSYSAGGDKTITFDHVQVSQGTEIAAYEPYLGGKPSPSPDYPQPLVAAEGNLTASGRTGTTPTTVTLPELRAIPGSDIRDTLAYIGSGQWKLTRRVGVTVVDGETIAFTGGEWWNLPAGSSLGVGEVLVTTTSLGITLCGNSGAGFLFTQQAWAAGVESADALNALCQVAPMTIWYELVTPITETVTLGELPSYPVHTALEVTGDYPPDVAGTVKVGI